MAKQKLDFYGFFDYVEGVSDDSYEYTSEEFSNILRNIAGTGIFKGEGDEFATELSGDEVIVKTGSVFINGRYGSTSVNKSLTLDAVETGYKRIDRVVLRLDKVNREIAIDIIKGTPTTGTAVAPDITRIDTVYELSLCKANIVSGSTTTLTDERNDDAVSGYIDSVEDVGALAKAAIPQTDIVNDYVTGGTLKVGSAEAIKNLNIVLAPDYNAKTIYVATTGNDTTGDGSSTAPYLTLQKAFDSIKVNWFGDVTINMAAGTYSITTSQKISRSLNMKTLTINGAGFGANGTIITSPNTTVIAVYIEYQNCRVEIANLRIDANAASGLAILASFCSCVRVRTVSTNGCNIFVQFSNSNIGYVGSCSIYNVGNIAVFAAETANVVADSNSGANVACYCYSQGSSIYRRGTYPSAGTLDTKVYGGQVFA